jgi:YVTN family beta-propeller protein
MVEYRILGPLEVSADGRAIEIPGAKLRTLLVILLLRANATVARDALVHELWGEHPPAGAQHSLEVYISRLRRALDATGDGPVVQTRPGGYRLQLAAGQLDASAFERLVNEGRTALAANVPEKAAADLRAALELWRGPALADLADGTGLRAEVARLDELRIGAIEDRLESELALGRHEGLVGELRALAARHPLRERLHGQLMVALYRCGRQAEALEAYRAARRTLVDELGLEPGPALRELEHAVLRQDAALDLPGRSSAFPSHDLEAGTRPAARGRNRKHRVYAAAGALALASALLVTVVGRSQAHVVAGPDTVGVIDTRHDSLSAVVTGVGRPSAVTYGAGSAWITDSADDLLLRVNRAGRIIDRIPVGHGPAGLTVGDGEVWVADELDGTVSEVNPGAGTQVAIIPVGVGPEAITFGAGSVWVANATSDTLSRIDAANSDVVSTIPLGAAPSAIAVGAGSVWVTYQETGELARVDPADNRVTQTYAIGQGPDGLAVGAGSLWVAEAAGILKRLDPRTGRVKTIRVGGTPAGVAYADGAVWVAGNLSSTVSRLDPATDSLQSIRVGNEPTNLAAAGGYVWATVLPSLASHRGGELVVISAPAVGHYALVSDPALAYSTLPWQILSLTNDGLVGYRRVGGPAGNQLVPDLAAALPVPTDGGRVYTFRLRAGLRYSTGALVRPEDFRRAIERVFMIARQTDVGITSFYAGIVGAAQCERSRRICSLARGIVADDAAGTVTFHLTAPDPEFLYKLAFPWADAAPSGLPMHQISAAELPATGPYMTKSLTPAAWVLVRNPRFRQWSDQAQPGGYPDRIIVRLDVPPGHAVADVERGQADVLLSVPTASVGQLATHYTSELHSGPLPGTIALVLNTRIAPFDELAARRAVNDAIDRNSVIALNGGPLTAEPTCQILPPTMPGYRPYCPYTSQPGSGGTWTAPNLAQAEHLVQASGTRGDHVTVLASNQGEPFPSLATGRYIVSVLRQIGYRASLRITSLGAYYNVLGDSRNHVQAGFFSWYEDYPAPSDFIEPLLSCGSFLPGNPGNFNDAEFCDPRIDGQASQALAVQAGNAGAAAVHWAAIDREITDAAPWVPLYNPRDLTLLSARVGNYQFHPYWNLLIDQLWVR